MSENLGPIHYMMYEKIKFQDKITSYLLGGKTDKVDEIARAVENKPLDQLIDTDNIHGWLDSKIDVVEKRLNYALKVSKKPKEKLFDLGKKVANGKDFSDYESIFQDLNLYLLDGMPCDRGLSAQVDDGNLYLITTNNLHSKYENEDIRPEDSLANVCEGGHDHESHESFEITSKKPDDLKEEKSTYHEYRYEFLKGYFYDSPYKVELINGINYKISKRI